MATQTGDLFLVNRSGVSYKAENDTLLDNLKADDLLLVNSGGTSYKITGAEFATTVGATISVTAELSIPKAVVGAVVRVSFVSDGYYDYLSTIAYQWKVAGVNVGTDTSSYTPVAADLGKELSCVITVTDKFGRTGTGTVTTTITEDFQTQHQAQTTLRTSRLATLVAAATAWASSNAYSQYALITNDNKVYQAPSAFTSNGTFDAAEEANWTLISSY